MEEMTFGDFLKSSDLTENLVQYILLSIAMVKDDCPAKEVSL